MDILRAAQVFDARGHTENASAVAEPQSHTYLKFQ